MIKVGDTFEVVKVLNHSYQASGIFKIGGTTIKKSTDIANTLLNGTYKSSALRDTNLFNQQALFLEDQEFKPIGRLKITKVK